MEEIWKSIPGYEGLYEASSLGRIRTAEGKTTSSARYPVRVWKQRVLKQKVFIRKSGKQEYRVCLWKDGNARYYLVARLIAMTFLDMPFDKLTVNHINGNPSDNSAENLEWCTAKENIQHGFKTGLYKANQKPVVLMRGETGIYFPSMSEADRFLGRSEGYTSEVLARGYCCYSTDGTRYSPLANGGEHSS